MFRNSQGSFFEPRGSLILLGGGLQGSTNGQNAFVIDQFKGYSRNSASEEGANVQISSLGTRYF